MPLDRLTKTVVSRLRELGLPPTLIDLDGFRDNFFLNRWVMIVRDGDEVADVLLVQPRRRKLSSRRRQSNY